MLLIDHPKLVIPADMLPYVREVVEETKHGDVPPWRGVMVYHPATNRYFASTTPNPIEYGRIIRTREPINRWNSLALVLHRLLALDPGFQLFVLNTKSRPIVEGWMARQGAIRAITKRGEAVTTIHCVFQVYSPVHKLHRYLAAPSDTPHDKLIKKINDQLGKWLRASDSVMQHERETMRTALRSRFVTNSAVFQLRSAEIKIIPTPEDVNYQNLSAYIAELNRDAIRQFIHNTTTGGAALFVTPFSPRPKLFV